MAGWELGVSGSLPVFNGVCLLWGRGGLVPPSRPPPLTPARFTSHLNEDVRRRVAFLFTAITTNNAAYFGIATAR